jgi:hypothetical protein
MFNFLKNIRRWFGYEKVAVIQVKRTDSNMYDPERDEIKVSKQWRRYYQLDFKNAFWNVKNFVKYKLNMDYIKGYSGGPQFKTVYYNSKILVRKKNDFAVIPKRLVDVAKKPVKLPRKTVGTVDRPTSQ